MKRAVAMLLLMALLAASLSGCGMLVVEDDAPVVIRQTGLRDCSHKVIKNCPGNANIIGYNRV